MSSLPFDKYDLYLKSVQSPENDVQFLRKTYKELRGHEPRVLREDFCGTFNICCEWVKLHPEFQAYGLDLDPEPIQYGQSHSLNQLSDKQKKQIHIHKMNVLDPQAPHADVVCAQNFSYYLFKKREDLKKYFQNVYNTLNDEGVFIVDGFGGSQCMEPNEEETEHEGFSYFWDQDSYDPVTHFAQFYIHFQPKGQKKFEKVFSYDWRMWGIPEIREIMEEVGFKKTIVYWEGTDEDGEGDGEFQPVEQGEDCESWVAYIAGLK